MTAAMIFMAYAALRAEAAHRAGRAGLMAARDLYLARAVFFGAIACVAASMTWLAP